MKDGRGNLEVYICNVNIDKSLKISTKDELIIDNPHSQFFVTSSQLLP